MRIFNTASRQIETFVPLKENEVGIYACGPTVYHYAHIGNMRTYVFEDILRRTFEKFNYKVNHVMNITDVGHLQSDADDGDDKMLVASRREKKSPWDIAKEYEAAFFQHAEMLNIKRPHIVCRATEHIPEMINMVKTLEEKGYAYESGGNVYFDVSKFPSYTDFASLKLEAHKTTERVSVDQKKRNQTDFVLWFSDSKFPNQIMKWDSPWGKGFPGWHIECSAMSSKYLGEKFDIHCGGIDHIPVHHTNEIAQSDCCHGHKSVHYWMHGAFLTVDAGKMSKSSGDFLTVDKLKKDGFNPLSYRYLILTSHYRNELKFSYDALTSAQNTYNNLVERFRTWEQDAKKEDVGAVQEGAAAKTYRQSFWDAMSNDLHTPSALAVAWAVVRDQTLSSREKVDLFSDFDTVLGLKLGDASVYKLTPEEEDLIARRMAARKDMNWLESDILRKELSDRGIVVKDTKTGMEWKKNSSFNP